MLTWWLLLEWTTLQYLCHYNVWNVHLSLIRNERHWLPWNCCRVLLQWDPKMPPKSFVSAVVVEVYVQFPPAGRWTSSAQPGKNKSKEKMKNRNKHQCWPFWKLLLLGWVNVVKLKWMSCLPLEMKKFNHISIAGDRNIHVLAMDRNLKWFHDKR